MQQYTDTELVGKIRQGESKAFELVFNLYGESLVRYAATIVKTMDEAEDVVQHLFVSIWAKKESFEISTSLKNYLYKAVYHSCLNKIKQVNVRQDYAVYYSQVANDHAAAATQELERKEVYAVVEKAIDELPEQCRLIFRMSRFEQLKYQEIADKLGLSVKTVENQMGKALKHMRLRLKDYMYILIIYFLNNN